MFGKRKDQNQAEIQDAAEKMNVWCYDASQVGAGLPDLLCYDRDTSETFWIEVKSDKGRLTKPQREFKELYPGRILVCRSALDTREQIILRRDMLRQSERT